MAKDDNAFKKEKQVTARFGLGVYSRGNKRYIDVTPLVVDCGGKYEEADAFRITSNQTIKDLKGKF